MWLIYQKQNIMQLRIKGNIAVSDSGFVFDPSTGDSYRGRNNSTDEANINRKSNC